MFDAAFSESFFCRFCGRFWAGFLDGARQSLVFRPFIQSRILTWITERLALISGILIGLLFAIPYHRFNNLYSLVVMAGLAALLLLGAVNGQVKTAALPRMGGYAAAFWLLVMIGGLASLYFTLSLRFLLFYITAFLALIIIRSLLTDRLTLTRFTAALMAAVALSGVYGLRQSMAGVEIIDSQVDVRWNMSMPGRVFSFYDNPNAYAMVLILTLPLFAAMFFMARTRPGRRIAFLSALPPAVALVLTFSRSGWMAFGLAAVIFFYFTYRWVVPLLFLGAAATLPFLPVTITERFFSTFAGEDSSILYRSRIRETLNPVIREHWLFGTGLGADAVQAELVNYYESNTQYRILTWQIAPHAHNQYLQLWAEMGIAGAAAFCGMMIAFIRKSVGTLFTAMRKNFIAAAGLGGIVGVLVMGFADYIWFYPRVMLLFWVVAGLVLSALKYGWEDESSGRQ